jgi:hypothetical protein
MNYATQSQSLGGISREPTTEISEACGRIRDRLNIVHQAIDQLQQRLLPMLPICEMVNNGQSTGLAPVPTRRCELGGSLHGYADEIEEIAAKLQSLITVIAL